MEDITNRLSKFVNQITIEDIPKNVIEKTRLLILDYYAACCAGYRMNVEFNASCEKLFLGMGGMEESTVLFTDKKLPASNAAFMNSCYAHGADMDDGSKRAMGHIGAHVISSVFALAEKTHTSEKNVLLAIITGYEVFCRVAEAGQPRIVQRGFHSTGIVGTIACAVACAKLLGMSYEKIYSTIFLAVTQSSGLLIVGESGQEVKPINPARAAQNGLQSALLVEYGAIGGKYPLESETGWFRAMADGFDAKILFKDLGEKFAINECYIKRFPSCRHTHGALDAALDLRENIEIDKIKEIRIHIYENAIRLAGSIKEPIDGAEAKFSIHYAVACAFAKGTFSLEDIISVKIDENQKKIISKIHLIPDSEMENSEKGIRGTRMQVYTRDGNKYEKTVWVPKGDPENPLSNEEVKEKFIYCSKGMITKNESEKIIDLFFNFGSEKEYIFSNIIL